jgi:subtilisin-like proprotein convertase family protein
MKNILIALFVLVFVALSNQVNAQLVVTGGALNAQNMAGNLAGSNISVTNATISGNTNQSGTFSFSGAGLNVNSGVIMSTGSIFEAPGPNSSTGTSTVYNGPGNTLLSNLSGQTTRDAVVLQFDFEVQTDEIEFNYIFLSEEYNEWVGSNFNDVFAFYISGPGIVGEENLAVVPGTTTPVSINTINASSFWQYFVDNTTAPYGTNIEFDGFTTLMTAKKSGLIPCETYTLKLMIADAGDAALDAAVLLQENSLVQNNVSASSYTYSANNVALEGCIQANFTFQLDSAIGQNTTIPIQIGGSATNGVDYALIDTLIVIPAGQTSATIIIDSYTDGITEGQESVELYYYPELCGDLDTIFLFIDDNEPIEFSLTGTNLGCSDDSSGILDLTITGGTPPYLITLTDTVTGISTSYPSSSLPITGLFATTYLIEVSDQYGCSAEALVVGGDFDAGQTFLPDGNGVSYTSDITISGFNAGQLLTSEQQINSICANMEHSYSNDLTIVLEAPNGSQVMLKNVGPTGGPRDPCNLGEPVASGPVDSWNASNITPGVGYNYCWTNTPTYTTMGNEIQSGNVPYYTYTSTFGNVLSDYYLPSGSYATVQSLAGFIGTPLNGTWSLIVTDNYSLDNGYIFEWSISLTSDLPDSTITLTEPDSITITGGITSAACGSNDGAIDITVSGDFPPFTFDWSNGATTEDISGIGAGTYTVVVADANGCEDSLTFNIINGASVTMSAVITDEDCISSIDGAIDMTMTAGATPFLFNWSNGATTEDILNVASGTYVVTVTDNIGCIGIETFDINEPLDINIAATLTDENCGDQEGIIDLNLTGGTPTFTFNWSTGETTSLIDELSAGTYYVTVTDNNLCTKIDSFTLINYVGNCVPNCDLEISNSLVTDELCGNANGAIDITIFTTYSPYAVQWSNGSTSEDLVGLSSGIYTVTITDAESCELIQDFTVDNETGTLLITSIIPTDETCGNTQGSVDLTITGGALPYSFNWSSGAITEDITNLNAATYAVTITDGNNCSVNTSVTVNNISGTLTYDWGNAVNEVCNNNQGSIDILLSGGLVPYTYNWSNGATTEDITNLNEGNYTCTITDNNGCAISTPTFTVINEGGTLILDNVDLDNEICGNANGEIEILVSGGSTPYLFLWSNGATTQDITNLSAGTYSATISDANGCEINTGNLTLINESGTLQLTSVSTTDEICNNSQGAVDITVTGGLTPYIYAWSNGSSSEDLINLGDGTYSCTVTDQNGCEVYVNTTVNDDQGTLAILNIITTNENCGGVDGAIDLVISGGTAPITFDWNSGQTTEDLTNIAAGSYVCTITDNQGCEIETNPTNILNNTGSLTIDNSVITNETCGDSNGSIDLTIGGTAIPFSFNWSNGATTEDISSLPSGTYTCTITDNLSCDIIAGPYTINNYSGSFSVTNAAVVDESCGDGNGSIDLTITGGVSPFTYAWNTGQTTEDISSLSAAIYSYTITDANNCEITGSILVENNAGTLVIDNYTVTDEICSNGTGEIDVNIIGGTTPYTFAWNTGPTTEDLTGLSQGTYIQTITDASGCSIVSNTMTVNNNAGSFALTDINVTDENCGDGTGEIDVILSGGANPIGYAWSNGGFVQDLTNLNAGVYSCTTTDANGCVLNYSATVNNNAGSLQVYSDTITDETCGDINGAIDLGMNGGTAPLTFSWNNGATTEDIINVAAGNYTCVVSDANGCTTIYNGTIDDIGGDFQISNISTVNEVCNNNSGAVNLTMFGGTTPYSFLWSNAATTEDISPLNEGTYSVTVTDGIGCETQTSVNIVNTSGSLSITSIVATDEQCGDGLGEVDLTYTGATNPTTTIWSNGATTQDLTNLSQGWYSVLITDANSCQVEDSAYVDNFTGGFQITNASTSDENCNDGTGFVDLTLTGGTTPYTFNWSNGATTEDLSSLNAGTYSCTITDGASCNIYYSYQVINVTNGLQLTSATVTDDYCFSDIGAIDIVVDGGVTPYTFAWSNGAITEDLTGIAQGTYTVTISDASSCELVSQAYVVNTIENGALGFSFITVTDDNCGNGQGSINFSPTGATNYTYELDGNNISSPVINNLGAGTYVVSVLEYGCRVDSTVTIDNSTPFALSIDSVRNEYCGDGNGAVYLNVSPAGTYSYNWSNSVYVEDNMWLNAGTYTCEVIDTNGCSDIISGTVNNIAGFTVNSTSIDDNCGDSIGSIDLTVIGSTSPYTYNWSNGAITEDLANLSQGTYTCTVTDTANCVYVETIHITNQTGTLAVTASVDDDFCNNAQGIISLGITGGSGNYGVLWNTSSTLDTLNGLSAGTYSVTITDNTSGCEYMNTYTVNNFGYFTLSEAITHSSCGICNDGAVDLTVTGSSPNYYFIWSNGATTEDITALLPGTYTVTVTDDWNCTDIQTYVIGFTTGIDAYDEEIEVTVYPNPTNGIIYIDYNLKKYDHAFMVLYNLLGEALLRDEVFISTATVKMDLSGLPVGVYYLNVYNEYFRKNFKVILK